MGWGTTKVKAEDKGIETNGTLETIAEDDEAPPRDGDAEAGEDEDDIPLPPCFPAEDAFEGFLCYKCVDAHPWIKRYANTPGFLAPVFHKLSDHVTYIFDGTTPPAANGEVKKRKAEDDDEADSQEAKRQKTETETSGTTGTPVEHGPDENKPASCKLLSLPPAPRYQFSLFFKDNFREHLCRCSSCFPLLAPHPQLLEEEETYEPPVSEDGGSENGGGSTAGSGGSLYDRGESALRNVDRVRAIEGVMAYQHLKDKLMPFFQQFAESKKAISAEDIKEYFAKLRGDDQAIKEAGEAAGREDHRKEQSGY
jgi:E3 ubiquitin-protein ligase UBR7